MPASEADLAANPAPETLTELPFPPVTRQHILNCSYHSWYSRYRSLTPKCRLIALSPAFVAYLRADGIVLPDDEPSDTRADSDSEDSFTHGDDEDDAVDPSAEWSDIHTQIKSTITELGGRVVPKLNWSAPKDAAWINATNSMDCRSPNDIYLLLKSSDFITHDLEHAFDGCIDASDESTSMQYHLVLRKHINMNPSVEFRCFVRRKVLLGICQRDLNHYDFLSDMQNSLRDSIQDFFDAKLRDTFPDSSFVFDVYIPAPHQRVWLIDINPWAPRTDPLLFSWLELLTISDAVSSISPTEDATERFVRFSLNGSSPPEVHGGDAMSDEDVEEEVPRAEFRLIRKDDPEAYSFNTPQYSAHKLPRDVVEAAEGGVGPMREFAEQWKEVLEQRRREDAEGTSDGEEE